MTDSSKTRILEDIAYRAMPPVSYMTCSGDPVLWLLQTREYRSSHGGRFHHGSGSQASILRTS